MKKTACLLALCALVAGSLQAAPVDKATAHRVAVNFWNVFRPVDKHAVQEMQLLDVADLDHLYVFANDEQGFVIVSANDCVRPVLGYSFDDPANDTPNPEARYWLNWMDKQVALWDDEQNGADPRWGKLLAGLDNEIPQPLTSVPALCNTKWDQGAPYNNLCPFDTVVQSRAVVGCVATAMAQIMKRWNHPSCGSGSHEYHHTFYDFFGYDYGVLSADFGNTTYMWQDMPSSANSATSSKAANALATISYHCGVAVDMMYGTTAIGGSAAYSYCGSFASACAEQAFSQYFKYKNTATYSYRYYYTDEQWMELIDAELAQGRPIYYDGSDTSGGHAFVLDGSNNDGTYHFNWGWSGTYNGYYSIDNLAPGYGGIGGNATYTFNLYQGAIFGIEPDEEKMDTVYLADTICSNYSSYPFYEYTLDTKNCDTMLRHLDTVFNLVLSVDNSNYATFNSNNGGFGKTIDIEYCRYDGITMPECTFEKSGYNFIGWGKKKNGSEEKLYQPGEILDTTGNVILYARWQDTAKAAIDDIENPEFEVWPNPANDVVYFKTINNGQGIVYLIDALGRKLISAELGSNGGQISLANLPSGIYLLQFSTNDGVFNKRIIKQ